MSEGKTETTEATTEATAEGGSVEGAAEVKEVRPRVKDPVFIRAWQSSNSVAEVIEATGIKTAGQRAMKLRKRGFGLKHMPKGGGARLTDESEALLKTEFEKINVELGLNPDGTPIVKEEKAETPAS